jgi:hypothetical protein
MITTTIRSRVAVFPTMMDGFTSRASPMDLAKEILESARPSPTNQGWFQGLSSEHQDAVLAVRDQWRKTSDATGVSASQMAKTIVDKLTARGYTTSKWRQVQRWLTQG